MPQMGVSVAEGTVVAWHKHVGDRVGVDETICEISTDKIDTDVPSPAAGLVVSILVPEGATVVVGTVLAEIAAELPEDVDPGVDADQPAAAAETVVHDLQAAMAADSADVAPTVVRAAAEPEERTAGYSPVVLRIAAEHGIDLAGVIGTGRDGRVRKQDVLALVEAAGDPAAAAAGGTAVSGDAAAGTTTAARADGPPAATTREPLSRMRRSIAEHMTRSLRTAAHCTTIIEVDFGRVEAARAGTGLSPLAYVARCTVGALGAFGRLNATLEDDVLTRYADVNLGVAVSLGERGLIVPVIRRAQDLSVERAGGGDPRRGGPGPGGRARAGRRARRDVHDHQPRAVGHDRRHADHQSAAGGDPRPRGRRQAGGSRR